MLHTNFGKPFQDFQLAVCKYVFSPELPHTFLAVVQLVYVDVNVVPKLHIIHTRSRQSETLLRLLYVRAPKLHIIGWGN